MDGNGLIGKPPSPGASPHYSASLMVREIQSRAQEGEILLRAIIS